MSRDQVRAEVAAERDGGAGDRAGRGEDVFSAASGDYLRAAAVAAGHQLGVFAALAGAGAPRSLAQLAGELAVAGTARLRALIDVLAAIGAVVRGPDGLSAGAVPPPGAVAGADALADAIRRDRPIAIDGDDALRRYHAHLVRAGAAAAHELAPRLGAGSLVDLGGGAGVYTAAFLTARPAARATLVDAAPVIALAGEQLARFGDRVRLVAGDARTAPAGAGHGAALLANVLHLHPESVCVELCGAAARAVAPGGVVVVKDLHVDDDRRGPLAGLLFALAMAMYTEAGDVHPASLVRRWLAGAGLVDIEDHRLAAAPDAIVLVARRPCGAAGAFAAASGLADASAPIGDELDAALARGGDQAWRELAGAGGLRPGAEPLPLALPLPLRRMLAAAIALERGEPAAGDGAGAGRIATMLDHYTRLMPQQHTAQLAGTAEPGATLLHTALAWPRLPRLTRALDRLFGQLIAAGVDPEPALGAPSAAAFRAATPTLAALYRRTHYGACMPLLYGNLADLAYVHGRGAAAGLDVVATIDRYLTAPVIHELCHFARGRDALLPHLDECVAGWLGVHVWPEFAYPEPGHDDAIYAAPWLSQIGQAVARAFGVAAVVRGHAGALPWDAALPWRFVDAATRLMWDDWRARRTIHFLSDTFDPEPWIALALVAGAGRPLAGETLGSLARTPLAALAGALPDDAEFDRAITADALRAMCLDNACIDGSFRARTRLPDAAIAIDAAACRVSTERRSAVDWRPPRYWLPPAAGARIAAAGLAGYELRLAAIAAIPEAAAAICAGSPGLERDGFQLVAHPAP